MISRTSISARSASSFTRFFPENPSSTTGQNPTSFPVLLFSPWTQIPTMSSNEPSRCAALQPSPSAFSSVYFQGPLHVTHMYPTVPNVHHIVLKFIAKVDTISPNMGDVGAPHAPLLDRWASIARLTTAFPPSLSDLKIAHYLPEQRPRRSLNHIGRNCAQLEPLSRLFRPSRDL